MDENYNDWKYKIINKRMQLKNAIHHEKLIKLIKKTKKYIQIAIIKLNVCVDKNVFTENNFSQFWESQTGAVEKYLQLLFLFECLLNVYHWKKSQEMILFPSKPYKVIF